ncbi:hypothetical protein V1274_003722 [Bradyrhizobium sp. AZCC 1614]|uniref:hypothetical protein n=1 Tax=Bradyrhizobium sp. AZCC 1614 TaxID=3117017 RepID=UPI002FF16071
MNTAHILENSNSFAAAALKHAGFFGPGTPFPEFYDRLLAVDPVSGKVSPVFVTGFDQRLTNPLNKSATMRTPVQELEIPLVPTNGNPQHRRQNLFNGRFGIWAAPPSGSLNQPAPSLLTGRPASMGDKPVRYLSRRIAGKPEASVFGTGTPPVPFVPTNDFFSPDINVSFGDRLGEEPSSAYGHGSARETFPPTTPSGLAGRIAALAGIDPAKPTGTPQTSDGATSSDVDANRRFLTRHIAGQPGASVFDTGAPPVPVVPIPRLRSVTVSETRLHQDSTACSGNAHAILFRRIHRVASLAGSLRWPASTGPIQIRAYCRRTIMGLTPTGCRSLGCFAR